MGSDSAAEEQQWMLSWKSAGQELAAERSRRLRAMTEAERREAIMAVLTVVRGGPVDGKDAEGMLEMQRRLGRAAA